MSASSGTASTGAARGLHHAGTNGIVSGLSCGTNYTLAVDAYDAAGNHSSQTVVMVATTACADTQAPAAPTGLKASNVTQTGMTVAWTAATDNVGVTGYDVYRNGTKIGSTASPTYALASLTCNTVTVAVVAYDAAGNRSTKTQLSTSTAACSTGSGAQVVISPTGSDSNACTPTAPCQGLARAYQVAQSGNTIEIDGGTYSTSESQNRLSGSKNVTFRVQSGEVASFSRRVVLYGLQNATIYGPFSTKPAYNHSQDIKDFSVDGCSNNLNLYDIRAGLFDVSGSADNVSFYGGDFGGYTDRDQEDSWVGGDGSSCGDGGIVSNLLFDGIYLHDVLYVSESGWGDAHPDCLQTGGLLDGMTIRNSRIMRCGNSFFGFYGDFGNFTNILIENNLFYGIKDSYWGFNIDPKSRSCSITIRYNTYDPDNPQSAGYANSPASVLCQSRQVYGNIFRAGEPGGGCNGSGWSYNVFESGSPCGTNATVGAAGFVSRGSDYHLNSGALALGKGDPNRFPSTDVDGQARSSPPDAGYDER